MFSSFLACLSALLWMLAAGNANTAGALAYYPPEVLWVDSQIDHFNPQNDGTFPLKVLPSALRELSKLYCPTPSD